MHAIVTMGRPLDAHFYRPVIATLAERGHEVSVFVRDHDGLGDLLDEYGIDHETLASAGRSIPTRVGSQVLFEARLYATLRSRDPDVLTGLGGVTAAHVAAALDTRSVVFADAVTAPNPRLIRRFADAIHTPDGFEGSFGPAHRRFDGYGPLAYLHPRRFDPDPAGVRAAGIDPNTPYFVLEFGAERAPANCLSAEARMALASYLSTYGTVHVLCDELADPDLPASRLACRRSDLHDVLSFADLYVGDCPIRATEAALLGTPAVRCRGPQPADLASLEELADHGLVDSYQRDRNAVRRVRELVPNPAARSVWRQRRDSVVSSKVDVATYAADAICDVAGERTAATPATPIASEPGGTSTD